MGVSGEAAVVAFKRWMDKLLYSLYSSQIAHVFEDGEAHLHREELCKDHIFPVVKPDILHLNSREIFTTKEEVVSEEHIKSSSESGFCDGFVGIVL